MSYLKLIILISLVNLSGCSVVNTLRMQYANDDVVPIWHSESPNQVFNAVYIGEKPYMNINIDGQELLFLIDTGASFSILFDTAKGKNVKISKGYELAVSGWGEGESTPAYQATISSLSLGDIKFDDVKVAFIPLSTTPYYYSKEEAIMDGVIGYDLMRHFAWTFDKQENQITLSRDSVISADNDYAIGFETFFRKISVPSEVHFNDKQSFERDIVIDTGSRHYFKLNTAFVENEKIKFDHMVTAADFGMRGKVEHKRVVIEGLHVGQHTFSKVKTNLIPSKDEDDWWVIGSALMNQYKTIIDFHSSQFALIPYKNNKYESLFNLSGLELRKLLNGNFIVRYISPDFDASQTILEVGDEIESVKGISSANLTEQDWLHTANTPQEIDLCIHQKTCIPLSLKHIEGYSQ